MDTDTKNMKSVVIIIILNLAFIFSFAGSQQSDSPAERTTASLTLSTNPIQ